MDVTVLGLNSVCSPSIIRGRLGADNMSTKGNKLNWGLGVAFTSLNSELPILRRCYDSFRLANMRKHGHYSTTLRKRSAL